MALIDFHCHLTEVGGYAALDKPRSLFSEASSLRVLAVTNRPTDWMAMRPSMANPHVAWAIGLHPALSIEDRAIEDLLGSAANAEAIGEVGLDYSDAAHSSHATQRRCLDRILSSDGTRGAIISLHSRAAARDVVSAVNDHRPPGAILHWFLGSEEDVERAIDLDVFYSVNLAMLRNARGLAVVRFLPPNRVLLETDAPYGVRRAGRYSEALLQKTIDVLSGVWTREPASTRDLIRRNQSAFLARLTRVPRALADLLQPSE